VSQHIRLPFPHVGQQQVRQEARRFNWLSAGRRWRKTTLAMALSVEEAVLPGRTIIWGGPTFDQVRVAWTEARRAVAGIARFNQSTMTAYFPSGGRIIYRSLDDPDHARGHTADGIVIDEAGDVAEIAWYEVLRPMLMDTGGWFWALGTPKGRNWFWREFLRAPERTDSRAWNAPTLGCRIVDGLLQRDPHPLENPEIPFDEVVQMHRTMPERVFRQEILAEFIEDEGGVFRKVADAIDIGRVANDEPEPGKVYSMGVDLARVQDFTVITIVDQTGRQVYFDRFNQISWERQIGAIEKPARHYRAKVFLDSTGLGDPIFERLRQSGVNVTPYAFTNASKEVLIDNLAMKIEQGHARLLDHPSQRNELLAYQYELTPSRNIRMNAPEGSHDDCVISLALAYWGLARSASQGPAIVGGQRTAGQLVIR
jgi:hypothetical protein